MAHASAPCVFENLKVTVGMGLVLSEMRDEYCTVCALAKFTQKSFNDKREKATHVGQILHVDIIGPIKPKTFSTQKRYVLIVVDGYSRFLQSFVMKTRDETPTMVNEAFCEIQSYFPDMCQFETFQCDKAGEFKSIEFLEILWGEFGVECDVGGQKVRQEKQ